MRLSATNRAGIQGGEGHAVSKPWWEALGGKYTTARIEKPLAFGAAHMLVALGVGVIFYRRPPDPPDERLAAGLLAMSVVLLTLSSISFSAVRAFEDESAKERFRRAGATLLASACLMGSGMVLFYARFMGRGLDSLRWLDTTFTMFLVLPGAALGVAALANLLQAVLRALQPVAQTSSGGFIPPAPLDPPTNEVQAMAESMSTDEIALWIASGSAALGTLVVGSNSQLAAQTAAKFADQMVEELRKRNPPLAKPGAD